MLSWETFKIAAIEYGQLHPHLVAEEWTPTYGSKEQAVPDNVIGVERIDWGVWSSLYDVMTGSDTDIVWDFVGATLYLNPAPTEEDNETITVVWRKLHAPDEETESFPTVPVHHVRYIEALELAADLERQADEIEAGPVSYAFGQMEVSRDGAAEGLRKRAASARQRVENALAAPLAVWG